MFEKITVRLLSILIVCLSPWPLCTCHLPTTNAPCRATNKCVWKLPMEILVSGAILAFGWSSDVVGCSQNNWTISESWLTNNSRTYSSLPLSIYSSLALSIYSSLALSTHSSLALSIYSSLALKRNSVCRRNSAQQLCRRNGVQQMRSGTGSDEVNSEDSCAFSASNLASSSCNWAAERTAFIRFLLLVPVRGETPSCIAIL